MECELVLMEVNAHPAVMSDAELRPAWPHAPPHWLFSSGSYFVTASTFHREKLFDAPEKLTLITRGLIDTAKDFGWSLKAWAVLANHCHFMADSPEGSGATLREWLKEFHRSTAVRLNEFSQTPERRVWMNFRDSRITHQTSWLARLNYVNQNPVRHGLVPVARQYRWCSAAWFETNAPASFVASVSRFKAERLNVWDDFD